MNIISFLYNFLLFPNQTVPCGGYTRWRARVCQLAAQAVPGEGKLRKADIEGTICNQNVNRIHHKNSEKQFESDWQVFVYTSQN